MIVPQVEEPTTCGGFGHHGGYGGHCSPNRGQFLQFVGVPEAPRANLHIEPELRRSHVEFIAPVPYRMVDGYEIDEEFGEGGFSDERKVLKWTQWFDGLSQGDKGWYHWFSGFREE